MKRILVIAAIGALLLPSIASAQDGPGRPGQGRPGQGQGPGRPGNGNDHRPPPRPNPGAGNRPGNGDRPNRPGPGMRPPPNRPGPGFRPPGRPQFSWRGRHFNPIRGSIFSYPRGYSYRTWSIGALLPSLFLGSNYYYDDWRTLGIDAPPPGRRWVRYGPDLVLVNVRTRRIEDVIRGVFY